MQALVNDSVGGLGVVRRGAGVRIELKVGPMHPLPHDLGVDPQGVATPLADAVSLESPVCLEVTDGGLLRLPRVGEDLFDFPAYVSEV